jgi:hypothetical protein
LTVGFERTVLVVVRTTTTLTRLLDVLSLTGPDRRIQTVFTHDPANPAVLGAGVDRVLDALGPAVVPWEEATSTRFDLAVAASENDRLGELDAPVLLVPHGVGYQKFYPNSRVVAGLTPDRLVVGGRVVPAAIALSHQDHLRWLATVCPPAAARGAVVGDPCLARMLASRHREEWYRAGFGARDKRLVVLASTWGPESLLGRWPELPDQLLAQLPADEYQVAAILHPGIWAAHGPWQVRAWLSRAAEYGLHVVSPYEGWQAALVGASVVVSDHGSLALYAAALDKPLLMAGGDSPTTVPGSASAVLAAATTGLDRERDLRQQLDASLAGYRPGTHDAVVRSTVDAPEQCAQRLRPLIYQLLRLTEPLDDPAFAPVPAPDVVPVSAPTMVVGADLQADGVRLQRFPDLGRGAPHDDLHHRHIVADLRRATVGQLAGAAILTTGYDGPRGRWVRNADAQLSQWPQATIVAAAVNADTCLVRTRDIVASLNADEGAGVDPLLLASLAYTRLRTNGRLPATDRLWVGGSAISVAAVAG